MKSMKKIIPALCMLLISAMLMGTSTYAWFSMNTTVGVTGMQVKVVVGDNLLIASSSMIKTSIESSGSFGYSLATAHTVSKLEPASSVDGKQFYYTTKTNVAGDGKVMKDEYNAVGDSTTNTSDEFKANYTNDNDVAYVDYIFQIKADNSKTADQYVYLASAKLTYGENKTVPKAFRAALFVDDMGLVKDDGTATTAANSAPTTLKTILAVDGAAYNDPVKAANSTTTRGTVTLASVTDKKEADAVVGKVPANSTKCFKVIVRLWLEGEDTTCTNTTFATLTSDWAFDLSFTMKEDADVVATKKLDTPAGPDAKIDFNGAIVSDSNSVKIVNGAYYWQITKDAAIASSANIYIKGTDATTTPTITKDTAIYKIVDSLIYDVTNQFKYVETTPAGGN